MTPQQHNALADRILASLQKVTVADYEAVIEGCMLAGTHWLNSALHTMGLSTPEHDALHVEYMVVHERYKAWLLAPAVIEALEGIEAMRALHVRGNAEGGEAAAQAALTGLEVIRRAAMNAVPLGLTPPHLGHISVGDEH